MNAKTFVFWSGIGIVALAGAFIVIRLFVKAEQKQAAQQEKSMAEMQAKTRKEAGFHAMMREDAPIKT